MLGAYRFDRYKTAKAAAEPEAVTVLGSARADAKVAREAIRRGRIVAEAVCWARDLVNTPAGDMPPAQIAREAQKMARRSACAARSGARPSWRRAGSAGSSASGRAA